MPIPGEVNAKGRTWCQGAWRTNEGIEKRKEAVRKELRRQDVLRDIAAGRAPGTLGPTESGPVKRTGGGDTIININNADPNTDPTNFINQIKFHLDTE